MRSLELVLERGQSWPGMNQVAGKSKACPRCRPGGRTQEGVPARAMGRLERLVPRKVRRAAEIRLFLACLRAHAHIAALVSSVGIMPERSGKETSKLASVILGVAAKHSRPIRWI